MYDIYSKLLFQMKKLINESYDLQVDDIIQRVIIRNNNQQYNYNRKDTQQLTSQEHLWHYRLQQENVELKQKIKNLNSQFRKKYQQHSKYNNLHKQIKALKIQLNNVLKSNACLQQQINEMRLKNNSINDSLQNSLDQSIKNRKNNRSCSCISSQHIQKNNGHKNKIVKLTMNDQSLSPQREILKVKKDVSIICLISNNQSNLAELCQSKKQSIQKLKRIVSNQQRLLSSYISYIQTQKDKQLLKNKSLESTSKHYTIGHTVSYTTFKPMVSAGSIVKIKRK